MHLSPTKWKSLCGQEIKNITTEISKRNLEGKYTFHVGTDSKQYSRKTIIVTTICFREKGYGVIVFYQKREIENLSSMSERLIHETMVSLECAEMVRKISYKFPTVHLDINPIETAKSSRMLSAAVGMVEGMGYDAVIKPDAWAADIADMFTR
jgi:uncharacterized protein